MKKNLSKIVLLMSASALLLAGCQRNAEDAKVQEAVQTEETQELKGEAVEMEQEADTIVASSVAVVQILDALGVQMAGVPTSSYELPESVAEAVRIGNPMEPDLEVIASLEPTIVVSVNTLSEDLKTQFETIGAEAFFVDLSSYEGLKASIRSLGERFGVEEKAEALVQGFEEREGAVEALIADQESPSVLIIFGAGSSFMVASEDTYVGDLVKKAGGTNVITDAPASFSPVDMEYLASQNPEYILFMAHANPEESLEAFRQEFEKNEAWQSFDAVKNDQVIALETGMFGMSANLQAIDALEALAGIFYE